MTSRLTNADEPEDITARQYANEVLMCECGHSLTDHRGRASGIISCFECDCQYFYFARIR